MKILLIQPFIEDFYTTSARLQPLGLAYLKSALLHNNPSLSVRVLDLQAPFGRYTISLPQEMGYLREYYPFHDRSPFSLFHEYYRFGPSDEKISQLLREFIPDLVGISSLFTAYSREVLHLAGIVKKATGALVALGGFHPSAKPEEIISNPAVDFVITGEGEQPFCKLVDHLSGRKKLALSHIENIYYKEESEIKRGGTNSPASTRRPSVAEDLFLNLIPDTSDLNCNHYQWKGKPVAMIIAARGCPHRCTFCSVNTISPGYRVRDVSTILKEIQIRYAQGYRVIDFEDDNLTANRSFALELLTEIYKFQSMLEESGNEPLELVAMNGLSYGELDQELLNAMRAAGFSTLNVSLVAAQNSMLRRLGRLSGENTFHRQKFVDTVMQAHATGFSITSYFIAGLPGQTLDQLIETIQLLAGLPVKIGVSPFYFTPGTSLQSKGYSTPFSPPLAGRLTSLHYENGQFQREDIYTILITCRIINHLKENSYSSESVAKILQKLETERRLYGIAPGGLKILKKFRFSLYQKIMDTASVHPVGWTRHPGN